MPPTYKESLHAAMLQLARDPAVCFVGYGIAPRGQGVGTFAGIDPAQLIEMPVAENLMMGAAIGLALAGRKPLVYIERYDFILNALDALVNHLDKLPLISGGEFAPRVLVRVVQGNSGKPLYTGPTHVQNFTEALARMVSFPVIDLANASQVELFYDGFMGTAPWKQSAVLVERKDLL